MICVAFLQNMWVKNPVKTKAAIERHGESFRLKFMEYALFAGCTTGRRLKIAFPEYLRKVIVWEETTREIADNPKTIFPAQPDHIRKVIETHQPKIVLAFGKIAADSVFRVLSDMTFAPGANSRDITFITAPHPAARQTDTLDKLKKAAEQMRVACLEHGIRE